MPRTSPYSITLDEAERTELEARARRYTSPYSDVVRARIVLYAADGLG
ncbi:MAG: IS630 family transposase, partial [Mycobacterium sp.]